MINNREIVNATFVSTDNRMTTPNSSLPIGWNIIDSVTFSPTTIKSAVRSCYEYSASYQSGILFAKEYGEVRPVNQAVKLWEANWIIEYTMVYLNMFIILVNIIWNIVLIITIKFKSFDLMLIIFYLKTRAIKIFSSLLKRAFKQLI